MEARSLALLQLMNKIDFSEHFMKAQKPGRYSGGEPGSIKKDFSKADVSFAFCFPDTYEIGMSHLGMKILYSQFNERDDIVCERVFTPGDDFEKVMRQEKIPLFSLESRRPVKDFDIIGFTLQYEMCFTNVLNMLHLAGIDIHSKSRTSIKNLVVAGGPCACNPDVLADFIDLFFIGEGEEVDLELIDLYKKYLPNGDKNEFLKEAAKIQGVYVPSLYTQEYNDDGTVKKITAHDGAPQTVYKRIIKDMDNSYYPPNFAVPYIEIVHDRAVEEICRGCIRGCRFCQAGYIYRPVREKSPEVAFNQAKKLIENTGYDEICLSSLSTSDYSGIIPLLNNLIEWGEKKKVSVSLPSLRIDNFPQELLDKVGAVRKSGLTFAPEAGTQRLRDVINKNITEEDILNTCQNAFNSGITQVKLYFMLGLPTETDEDIIGIADLCQKIVDLYYANPNKPKGKSVTVSASVAAFVPKPFTPFQYEPQLSLDEIDRRQKLLKNSIRSKKINLSTHDAKTAYLEAVFARGDRKLSKVIETAWKSGCVFDAWGEFFSFERWMDAFKKENVDPEFYIYRKREFSEIFPWDMISYGVKKSHFERENILAHEQKTTPNCRGNCTNCLEDCFKGGVCFEKRKN